MPYMDPMCIDHVTSLRIQVSPKEGMSLISLFWGWDWNPQSYSGEVSGFLGLIDRSIKF